jgi:uncharacterized iron-regulated membrane protein
MKIRSDIIRIYQSLHVWTGIITGLVLFIGFYAGSLTMFKPQIDNWLTPPSQTLAYVPTPQLDSLVSQVLHQDSSAQKGFTLYLQNSAGSHSAIQWFKQDVGRELHLDAQQWHGSLDENGQLISHEVLPSVLAELIDYLHRTAGIPGETGHEHLGVYILGVAAVLYFLAIVSGLILLLPSLVKSFFALRRNKGQSRFWLDAHNVIGITSLPFHLVISLTVVVFAFHDQIYDSLGAILDDGPQLSRPAQVNQYPLSQLLPVNTLIEQAQAITPDVKATQLTYMNLDGQRPMVRVSLFNETHLMRGPITDYAFIHPFSGQVINSTLTPGEEGLWARLVSSFFALHFGSFGGDFVRWSYFLLGLGGAFLFYSGNLLWLESRRKKFSQKAPGVLPSQRKDCIAIANATVGICLGSIAGVAITMTAAKLFYGRVDNINHVSVFVYYLVFLSCIAWAFICGPAKAAVNLQYFCAISTATIPLLSLIALLAPASGLWTSTTSGAIGVDIVALITAIIFGYFARLTRQRGLEGPRDSVWSLQPETKSICTVQAQA